MSQITTVQNKSSGLNLNSITLAPGGLGSICNWLVILLKILSELNRMSKKTCLNRLNS